MVGWGVVVIVQYSLLYSSAARDLWKDSRLTNEELDNLVFDLNYKLSFSTLFIYLLFIYYEIFEKMVKSDFFNVFFILK